MVASAASALVDAGVERELDVGQNVLRVGLRDEQRPTLACGLDGESLTVDDAHAPRDGVHTEPIPGEVEERQGRVDLGRDALVVAQQLDRSLGNERRTRHGIEHLTVSARSRHQFVDDARVHHVERRRALVHVVETGIGSEHRRGRMPMRANEPLRSCADRVERGLVDQLGPCRAEAHDDDAGAISHRSGDQRSGGAAAVGRWLVGRAATLQLIEDRNGRRRRAGSFGRQYFGALGVERAESWVDGDRGASQELLLHGLAALLAELLANRRLGLLEGQNATTADAGSTRGHP